MYSPGSPTVFATMTPVTRANCGADSVTALFCCCSSDGCPRQGHAPGINVRSTRGQRRLFVRIDSPSNHAKSFQLFGRAIAARKRPTTGAKCTRLCEPRFAGRYFQLAKFTFKRFVFPQLFPCRRFATAPWHLPAMSQLVLLSRLLARKLLRQPSKSLARRPLRNTVPVLVW